MKSDILIIGAGAAGLMAARELGKAGKKVVILEGRDRIGGRIMPLDEKEFGCPAQGGAEFVHGEAKVTRNLMKDAGLTFVPNEGEIWSTRDGSFTKHKSFIDGNELLYESLSELKEDVPITVFLEKYFSGDENESFRNSILKVVEGYDAADPKDISTLTLREEWLGKDERHDGRIKEGYGALLSFLQQECLKNGVKIVLNSYVESVSFKSNHVTAVTKDSKQYEADKIIVTVALPTLEKITFEPAITEKLELVRRIGYGNAIKIVIRFKTRWWEGINDFDLRKMSFLLTNEKFMTWWTQYPETNPVLVAWMAGPTAAMYKESSSEELLDIALAELSKVFKIEKQMLKKELVTAKVANWVADPLTLGAYSYTTINTKDAYDKLALPIDNTVFFAGEATYSRESTAMVEGALGSGLETANKILKS